MRSFPEGLLDSDAECLRARNNPERFLTGLFKQILEKRAGLVRTVRKNLTPASFSGQRQHYRKVETQAPENSPCGKSEYRSVGPNVSNPSIGRCPLRGVKVSPFRRLYF